MNPLTSLGSTPFVAPVKSAAQPHKVGQPEAAAPGGDLADLSLPSATVAAAPVPEVAPAPVSPSAPAPAPPAPVPVTLAMEEAPHTLEEMSWILQSAASTPLADHPALAEIKQRFPQLPEEVRNHGTLALLDALTIPNPTIAGARLDQMVDTITWARKNKGEARELLAEGGDWQTLETAAAAAEEASRKPLTSLDQAMASPGFLKAFKIGQNHEAEGARLIDQFDAGNPNPGIGTKTLGKGICYLRGREGTRIFYRMKDDVPQWLVVCNKSNEDSAISLLRREFDLR